jgi:hypothetical protein
MQRSIGTLVGVLDYKAFPHGLENALTFILESVDRKVRVGLRTVFWLTVLSVISLPEQHRGTEELL